MSAIIIGVLLNIASIWLVKSAETFPVEELYNFSILANPDMYFKILDTHLCQNQTSSKNKFCSCRSSCKQFKICCVDYFWYDRQFVDLNDYFRYFLLQMSESKTTQCLPITLKNNTQDYIQNVYMVNNCPSVKNNSATDFHPVIGNDQYVYKNPSVAKCHSVKELGLLNIEVFCEKPVENSSDNRGSCLYKLLDTSNVESCNPAFAKFTHHQHDDRYSINDQLCNSYYGNILYHDEEYRNVHCLLHKKLLLKDISLNLTAPPLQPPLPASTNMRYSLTISFSKNLLVKIKDQDVVLKTIQCEEQEIFSYNSLKCVPFECGIGYKTDGFKCIYTNQSDINTIRIKSRDDLYVRLRKCMYAKSLNGINLVLKTTVADEAAEVSKYLKLQKTFTHGSLKYYIFFMPYLENMASMKYIFSKLKKADIKLLSERVTLTDLHGVNIYRNFPNSRLCYNYTITNSSFVQIDDYCNLNITENHKMITNATGIDPNNYIITADLTDYSYDFNVVTCQKYHLFKSCPVQVIAKNKFEIDQNFGISISDDLSKHIYRPEEYIPLQKGIGLCGYVPQTEYARRDLSKQDVAEMYLALICCIISLICYPIIIYTYVRNRELHTVSGYNIILICVILMIADTIFLLAYFIKTRNYCKTIAVFLHWSLLAILTCTSVISFEIWYAFQSIAHRHKQKSIQRFLYYVFATLMVPTIIVLTAYILDQKSVFSIGYGDYGICWIVEFYGRIIFYIIPFVTVEICNILTLIYVLYKIYKQGRVSSQLLNKKDKLNDNYLVGTALKLIVLLGLVELVGLIQIQNPSDVGVIINTTFRFLFTILHGGRGLMILLLYVIYNPRARKSYTECCKKSYDMEESRTTTKSLRFSTKSQLSMKQNLIQMNNVNDV